MQKQEKAKLQAHFEEVCARWGETVGSSVIDGFMEVVEAAINDNDRAIYEELKNISTHIHDLKHELSHYGANSDIPGASVELGEVAKSIEEATHTILDRTEDIQAVAEHLRDESACEAITGHVTKILEACNFQDIAGQRINKVLATLEFVESSTQKLLSLAASHTPEKGAAPAGNGYSREEQLKQGLLNGPQNSADAPSQDDIDKLFNS